MTDWPGNPIASMVVTKVTKDAPSDISLVRGSSNTQQKVAGGQINFKIAIQYNDPNGFGGRGVFVAELRKQTFSGWESIDLQSKLLNGVDGQSGTITRSEER